MNKLIAALVATTFVIGAAFAQAPTTPATPATPAASNGGMAKVEKPVTKRKYHAKKAKRKHARKAHHAASTEMNK